MYTFLRSVINVRRLIKVCNQHPSWLTYLPFTSSLFPFHPSPLLHLLHSLRHPSAHSWLSLKQPAVLIVKAGSHTAVCMSMGQGKGGGGVLEVFPQENSTQHTSICMRRSIYYGTLNFLYPFPHIMKRECWKEQMKQKLFYSFTPTDMLLWNLIKLFQSFGNYNANFPSILVVFSQMNCRLEFRNPAF